MKKLKLFPSVLMLALCIGILGIGIYAATPTNNVITGTITVNAANAGIKVEVFEGQEATGTALATDTGRTETEIALDDIDIDASNALSLEDVETKYYTIRFSTTSTHKFVVDTETIQLVDGTITETSETKEDAIIITKNHKKYLEDDTTGLTYFTANTTVDGETTDNSYVITIAIRLGELPEQAFGAELNMQFDVHKLSEWVDAGNTGINGIDYLHYGEYPQTLASTSLDGYTKLQDADSNDVTFAAYDDTTGGKTTRDVYTDGTNNYVLMETITEWGWNEDDYTSSWTTTGTYLYKIEPLKWNILERDKTTGRAKLVCDSIIEQVKFQYNWASEDGTYYAKDYQGNYVYDSDGNKVKANNYEYSLLRSFMNDTFYNSAFNASEKAVMLLETVDNTTTTETGTSTNANACADTTDYIFALSYQDVVGSYDYSSDSGYSATRTMYPSNYASATGAYTYTSDYMEYEASDMGYDSWLEYAVDDWEIASDLEEAEIWYEVLQNSGDWWLRSPGNGTAYSARCVGYGGYVYGSSVDSYRPGCVPALLLGL